MTPDMKAAILCCLLLGLGIGLVLALADELSRTQVIVIRADHDLSPGEISAVVEEAKRITGESSL